MCRLLSGRPLWSSDDCNSLVCTDNQCQAPRCDDQVQNGQETDRDCGGPCTDCTAGQGCSQDTDCDSDVCSEAICQAPSCEDGVLNGEEFGIDCGGACPSCSCVGDAVTDIAEVGNYPGDTTNAFSFEDATCADTGESPESAFRFTPQEDGVFCAATVDADFDTVIYLREQCDDRATERRCNDSFDYPRESLGRLEFVGQADVPMYLIVDGYGGQFSDVPDRGTFTLAITTGRCDGAPVCVDDADCGEHEGCDRGLCIAEPIPCDIADPLACPANF